MFSLPSRGRPHNLARFITAYVATGATHPVWVRLDLDDPKLNEYHALDVPGGWMIDTGPRLPNRCNGAVSEMFEKFPDEQVYGLLADDLLPSTPRWDVRLIESAGATFLAYGDDGLNGINLATHPVIGGELARAIGWLVLPGVLHSFVDTALHAIALRSGRCRYLPDVLLEHLHPIAKKAPMDEIYRFAETYVHDAAVFWKWQGRELRPLVEKIKARFGGDLREENRNGSHGYDGKTPDGQGRAPAVA